MSAVARRQQKRSLLGHAGFTLLEFAVSLGFMSAMGGLIAGSSLLAMRTSAETGAQAHVAVETAKTTTWLVRDIRRTDPTDTDLADGGPAVTSAQFAWTEGGAPVTCDYSLNGTDLERDCGSTPFVVGRSLSGLQFTRSGRLVTITYVITPSAAPDEAETIVLNVALGGG